MALVTKVPRYFANLNNNDRRVETVRFRLRLAALMSVPTGSVRELAEAIGISQSTMTTIIRSGHIPGDVCVKLERICGRQDFPRQWFNPELFSLAEA